MALSAGSLLCFAIKLVQGTSPAPPAERHATQSINAPNTSSAEQHSKQGTQPVAGLPGMCALACSTVLWAPVMPWVASYSLVPGMLCLMRSPAGGGGGGGPHPPAPVF
jgi:hypothetical protein